jgi:histidine triad (HIT) family protein
MSDYAGNDFYCDVAIPHPERLQVVHDGRSVLAFHHTKPTWPFHVVVVPKAHIESLITASMSDWPILQELLGVVQTVARGAHTELGAARVVTNIGRYQDSKHLHVHVIAAAES